MVFLSLHLVLLFKLVLDLILAGFQLFESASDLQLLTGELLVQLLDLLFLIAGISLIIDTAGAWVASRLER